MLALLLAGERERAVAEFERLAAAGFDDVPRDMLWFAALCTLAEGCALIGDHERAAQLYAHLAPYAARNVQIGMITCWGSADRYLGLLAGTLGEHERAVAHLQAALAGNEAGGMVHMLARVREELAHARVT